MSTDLEVLKVNAEKMTTPELAMEIQHRVWDKEMLKGQIGSNLEKRAVNNMLDRELRVLRPMLQKRQMRMKGF